jgi:hypothetical protein
MSTKITEGEILHRKKNAVIVIILKPPKEFNEYFVLFVLS